MAFRHTVYQPPRGVFVCGIVKINCNLKMAVVIENIS
jgi:hypothetical protein